MGPFGKTVNTWPFLLLLKKKKKCVCCTIEISYHFKVLFSADLRHLKADLSQQQPKKRNREKSVTKEKPKSDEICRPLQRKKKK